MTSSAERAQLGKALLAGAGAGLVVDLTLFPVDTLKTRLQSAQGFSAAGGLRGCYKGLSAIAVGAAPGAALFFATYESVRRLASTDGQPPTATVNMAAAALGEVAACAVRVPCDVVKQRAQVARSGGAGQPLALLAAAVRTEGLRAGLYRGFASTVLREVPFSLVQFPLWEALKSSWAGVGGQVAPWQSALCGALAGGVAASLTTPLDVAKTRIMLAPAGSALAGGHIGAALLLVHQEKGVAGLFAGLLPRVTLISVGGALFLGVYDQLSSMLR